MQGRRGSYSGANASSQTHGLPLNMIAMWSRNGTFERFREDDVAEHGGDGADSDGEVELDDEVEIGDDDDDDDDAATA